MKKLTFKFSKQRQIVGLVIIIVLVIGGYFILHSRAAQPAIVIEAERASVSGTAQVVSSNSASGGGYLKFGDIAGVYSGVFTTSGLINNFATITTFEAQAQKPVSIINVFSSWGQTNGSEKFNPNLMNTIRNHGSMPLFTWEPWDSTVDPNAQPNFQLQAIINGQYDAYITQWAQDAKAWGHPFFLRFAHEMNGNWYPWDEAINGNKPGQYVAAWRHVHDIFAANQVTNVTWVWCVNTVYTGSTPIASLYPGDNYVDWVGYDAYNRGTVNGNSWRSFSQLTSTVYPDLQTIAPAKAVMVSEFGSVEPGGSKPQWFTDMLNQDLKTTYPRIKAISYFNLNKSGYDNTITSTEASRAAYAAGIGQSYYASNQYGNLDGDVIQPLLADALGTDTMPPYANINFPNTSRISAGVRLHMQATAIDKSGINRVDFYVNNNLICTEKQLPYECYWDVPAGIGAQYNITIKAYDRLNNMTQSSITETAQ